MTATPSPERLLEDLNASQREAVTATSGPLAILAGAGSGKTRVISRRAAYAIETGAIPADQILLVTFTDKAAGEMVERMASLGHRGVLARTFHAAALAQLRHFWPSRHDGAPVPAILDSKLRLLVPLVGRLPGGYRFTPKPKVARPTGTTGRVRVPPGAPMASTAAVATPDNTLLEALRRWRRERAAEDGVPAYVVFHDTTLVEIADSSPRTLPALRRIRGMGPVKLERYGAEILAVIAGAGDTT